MSEEKTPAGVPQPVFGISREALAGIVAGNRAALGLPPQESATAAHPLDLPAMAAFAVHYDVSGESAVRGWNAIGSDGREKWRATVDAAITVATIGQPDYCALVDKSTAAHWNVGLPGEQKIANAHRREAGLEEL